MILVLGAGGLLGSHLCARYPKDTFAMIHEDMDIRNRVGIEQWIRSNRPDAVINCAGIVKSHKVHEEIAREINEFAPIRIAQICDKYDIRMIQISTDCVFSGTDGRAPYLETDVSNLPNDDWYGHSKYGGEIGWSPHLTVRTSFVGWPDPPKRGLLAWLKNHKDGTVVPGWTNHFWSGYAITTLADCLMELAYRQEIKGIRHLSGERISKYQLLADVCEILDWDYKIFPVEVQPARDLSLGSVHVDTAHLSGWETTFREQLYEMRRAEEAYHEYWG